MGEAIMVVVRRLGDRPRHGAALPNLSAAVSDIAHPDWRGSAIGIYRFWRDLGYGMVRCCWVR